MWFSKLREDMWYPSIIDQNNMGPAQIAGKLLIPSPLDNRENRFNNNYWDRSISFVEDLLSQDFIDFGARYFGLPTYEEMFDLVYEYYTKHANPGRGLRIHDCVTDKRILFHPVNSKLKKRLFHDADNTQKRRLVWVTEKMPELPKKE